MLISPKKIQLPFVKKEQLAKDVWSFHFDRSKVTYDFYPGQYNRIYFSNNGRDVSRDFTISSSPLEKDSLTITTQTGKSTFKQALFALQAGELVHFAGPMGGFYIHEEDKEEKVFLAGGIGITPFRSMLVSVAAKKLDFPIKLFASFSSMADVVFYEELMSIAKENPSIEAVFTISQPIQAPHRWSGETGRISDVLLKKYIKDVAMPTYYIVGSTEMVSATEELLKSMGIEEGKIKIEYFTGYE